MSPLPRQGWLFLIEFLKWYFSKYWQVRTRPVFAQTVTNDIIDYVSSSCRLFADDCILYWKINSPTDNDILQNDLKEFENWKKIMENEIQ